MASASSGAAPDGAAEASGSPGEFVGVEQARKELKFVADLILSAALPISLAFLVSGWLAVTDSIMRRRFSFVFWGCVANAINLSAYYMYCRFAFPGQSLAENARRKSVNDVFRAWEVMTGLAYVATCEYLMGWKSALDEDIYRFHLPTFYGVVIANTPIEGIAILAVHGVVISPFLFSVQSFFGYLQHCAMLTSAAWMKHQLVEIAKESLELHEEHGDLMHKHMTQATEVDAQKQAYEDKAREYNEMYMVAREAVHSLTQEVGLSQMRPGGADSQSSQTAPPSQTAGSVRSRTSTRANAPE